VEADVLGQTISQREFCMGSRHRSGRLFIVKPYLLGASVICLPMQLASGLTPGNDWPVHRWRRVKIGPSNLVGIHAIPLRR